MHFTNNQPGRPPGAIWQKRRGFKHVSLDSSVMCDKSDIAGSDTPVEVFINLVKITGADAYMASTNVTNQHYDVNHEASTRMYKLCAGFSLEFKGSRPPS